MKKWFQAYYSSLFIHLRYAYYQFLRLKVPSRKYVAKRHYRHLGVMPNLTHPKTYNDKLLWMMLYWQNDQAKICADKYLVRDYVKQKIGDAVLNEVYQVVSKAKHINLSALPDKFVIKSTQGSGMNYICTDKSRLTLQDIIKATRGYTLTNYYYAKGREWVYKDMKPQIIVEKFLGEGNEVPRDYKIYCFHGEPFMIQVDINRFHKSHRENYYDTNWNLLPIMDLDCPSDPSLIEPAPESLPKLLDHARKLSDGFPHVRVDFYIIDKTRIVFGEMTFFTACGMTNWQPKEFDSVLGAKIKLPKYEQTTSHDRNNS